MVSVSLSFKCVLAFIVVPLDVNEHAKTSTNCI
jgi:hypothetical protein